MLLGPGAGDNAGAALGLGAGPGDVVVSLGTSGVVSAVSPTPTADPTGIVAGFADATGEYLPLVCTLNAARVLDAGTRAARRRPRGLAELALAAPAGAGGLVLVPYLEGERTPNQPDATGALHGLTLGTSTPAHLARAAVEGLLCGLADAVDALLAANVPVERAILVGGAARSEAVAPDRARGARLPGRPADARRVRRRRGRAAGGLGAVRAAAPPDWAAAGQERFTAEPTPHVRERYARGPRPHGEPSS